MQSNEIYPYYISTYRLAINLRVILCACPSVCRVDNSSYLQFIQKINDLHYFSCTQYTQTYEITKKSRPPDCLEKTNINHLKFIFEFNENYSDVSKSL